MIGEASLEQGTSELVTAARGGDREAMEALIKQELPWIRGVIAGYVGPGDIADDLCQEIFISAWQGLPSLRNPAGFRAWLYRIAINKVRSHVRVARRSNEVELAADVTATSGSSAQEEFERRDAIRAALQKLAPEYRDPLIVHYLDGKSCDETAEILGLRPVTTRIRLLRGRQKLAEILKEML